jgi:hypothetical protein
LLKSGSPIDKVCVDVANGYMPKLLEFVKELRNEFPHLLIMVGNVVTGDITQDLIINGADIVKVGIGPGCFHGDMKVKTDNGLKEIKDVSIGDKVLTHTGEYKEVVNKFEFTNHKKYIKINNIKCTPEHKFYVVNKKDLPKITNDDYKEYAYWCQAKDLNTEKQLLVRIHD